MYINDPIYGFIELNKLQESLMELAEFQRLQWIKQLGLSFLGYPGGVHTRASHAIGVSFVAGEFARFLGLSRREIHLVQAAGLLHDVGHTPFSHALESLLPMDHMVLTKKIISGEFNLGVKGAGRIPPVLKSFKIDPDEIASLINSTHPDRIIQNIIHGNIDADQLDYLQRDSYFCGIAHGNIDLYRILHTLKKNDQENCLVILEKGLDALEEMLVARDHMYSAVYAHKTGRIAEMMLLRACELALNEIPDFYTMVDGELLSRLRQTNPVSRMLTESILFRRLHKIAYSIQSIDSDELKTRILEMLSSLDHVKLEKEIQDAAGLCDGEVIIDAPLDVLDFTEPRLKKIDIPVQKKSGDLVSFLKISPIAQVLTKKESSHIVFGVYCPADHVDRVRAIVADKLRTSGQLPLF